MAKSIKKPKIAIISSHELGNPNIKPLETMATISYSNKVGLKESLQDAQAAFFWDVAQINELKTHWSWASSLKWIHAAVAGVDAFCFEEIRNAPIILTNAGGIYNYAIAEYVTGVIIAHERNFPRLYQNNALKNWEPFTSSSVQGKNALIIGPGQIGRTCAQSLAALGMNVRGIGCHSTLNDSDFERIDHMNSIEEHIGWAHHIIVTAPLTPQTHHLLNEKLFQRCRSSVHLINVGRGSIINTSDLISALERGEIGAATLDVLETEPLNPLSPLWDIPSVLITPHIAGEVTGFETALVDQFIENASYWIQGQPLKNIVDKEKGYAAKQQPCHKIS